jgi:hypothetical protein
VGVKSLAACHRRLPPIPTFPRAGGKEHRSSRKMSIRMDSVDHVLELQQVGTMVAQRQVDGRRTATMPGEVPLAHRGFLLPDGLAEFRYRVLAVPG